MLICETCLTRKDCKMSANMKLLNKITCLFFKKDPLALEEDKIREAERSARRKGWLSATEYHKKCPKCGQDMEYDPGDGCVHEPDWYCDKKGCHYNDRGFMVAGIVIMSKECEDYKKEHGTLMPSEEIKKKVEELKNEIGEEPKTFTINGHKLKICPKCNKNPAIVDIVNAGETLTWCIPCANELYEMRKSWKEMQRFTGVKNVMDDRIR